MIIIEDKGQQAGKHNHKHNWFEKNSIHVVQIPLPVGDYILSNDKVEDVITRKEQRGIDIKKMDLLGTYTSCVDTKKDIQEIIGNVCGKQHGRFRDECILAQNNGIKLYVLIENTDGVKEIRDLFRWSNPRLHRYNKIAYMHNLGKWQHVALPKGEPTSGETLAKAMLTMQAKYGVEFLFCNPGEAGKEIIELLNRGDVIEL